jgi:FkbM family methyltransferase
VKSYAQAGQDEWVQSIIGDSGYFVDVGAHDGIVHSNTYALEQLGWTGICVEPNTEAYVLLYHNRNCRLEHTAASDHGGTLMFDGVRVYPGAPDVPCARLVDLLERNGAPPVIDYLSIDVEGHELEVLAGMGFDRWHVRVATIEHNLYLRGPEHRDAIRERMIGLGFFLAGADVVAEGYGPYEDWWIHGDDL